MAVIKSVLVSAPVTALEVWTTYVLSGEASYLHAYNIETGEHLHEIHLLGSHTIHGICKGEESLLAVYGQKAVSVIQIESKENIRLRVLCEAVEFQDWVLDVRFLRCDNASPSCLGLVLAHNSILLWDWKRKSILQNAHCQENCILYSARLFGDSWEDVIVAAGTVFNQVVLWKPTGPKDDLGRLQVLRRLSGHQGVIFNLSYHKERQLLCSVSDDRSIRLWPLDLTDVCKDQRDAAQRVMYGHSARVWDAKILDNTIVSVGEDATCCVWNNEGDIIHRMTGHKGRSIWSLAVHDNQRLIVTGGGDSSIRIWSTGMKQEDSITTEELEIQKVFPEIVHRHPSHLNAGPELPADMEGFTPRQLTVLNSGEIVVVTLNGCLLCYSLKSKHWRLLSYDPRFQSYSLLSVCPNHKMAALGNIQGRVKIVALDTGLTIVETSLFTGKVFSLCWVDTDNLFVSGPDGLVIWLKLVKSTVSYRLVESAALTLPKAPQRWATTVAIVPHIEGALVCGDRRGSVLLYTNLHSSPDVGKAVDPTHCLPCVHGKAGVTQVCYHAGYIYSTGRDGTYRQYRLQGTRLHLLNTHKVYKGFHWIESLSFTSGGDVLVSGFHASSFIVWSRKSNETLVRIQCGGGHRAWGFATCPAHHISGGVTDPEPGGTAPGEPVAVSGDLTGHTSSAVFAFIKAKRVIVCSAPGTRLQQRPILKDSLHGRRITCVKFLANVALQKGECAVLATGSEDNAVNISAVIIPNRSKPAAIHVLHRLQVHISSIRCLATCLSSCQTGGEESAEVTEDGQRLLLFSVGGRRAIQCWRVTLPGRCPFQDEENVSQWLQSSCTVEHLVSYGNTDDVRQRRWLRKCGQPIDPETRFMSVCVWPGSVPAADNQISPGCFMLGVVGSDACIRIFTFNEQTKELLPLVSMTDLQGGCLLTAYTITHYFSSVGTTSTILLTAGTSGDIALWDTRRATGVRGQAVAVECHTRRRYTGQEVECGVGKESCVDKLESDLNSMAEETGSTYPDEAATSSKEPSTRNHVDISRTLTVPSCQTQDSNQHKLQILTSDKVSHLQEPTGALCENDGMSIGQLLLSFKAHQSGVNALCATLLDDNQYLLASGGDDNAIQLSMLMVSCDETTRRIAVDLTGTHSIVCAHASLISGLSFVDASTLVSSSIDQRLNVWRVRPPAPDKTQRVKEVEQISSRFLAIADCADMTAWTSSFGEHLVMVCGQGLQVLRLTEDQKTVQV